MKLINIFSEIYDFCKLVEGNQIMDEKVKRCIKNKGLHASEIITIQVMFCKSGYKTFKDYYIRHVKVNMKEEFPNAPSYTRFLELKNEALEIAMLYAMHLNNQEMNGIGFVDSFALKACHIRRASSHKTLKGIAAKGYTSLGEFFGLKLHVVINGFGEICSFVLSPGNVVDNNRNLLSSLTKNLVGKLFGDKGYLINYPFYKELFERGLQIITKLRKNMKPRLYTLSDALFLKKRGVIESVGNILKNHLGLEHTRHRSIQGCFMHIFSCLISYAFRDKKPSIFTKNLALP